MIEPIIRKPDAFDVSCSACGIVERFEKLRYGQVLTRLRATGWRILAGGHYCRECQCPVLSASHKELEELFAIELIQQV